MNDRFAGEVNLVSGDDFLDEFFAQASSDMVHGLIARYRQARERGVKLIGATAHFVTSDLDEGPIIEQNVRRVDHTNTVRELVALGEEQESRTLTEGVRLFAEHRVFLDGQRTVIFH